MSPDLRKKINCKKQNVRHILHRFYRYISVDSGKEIDPTLIEDGDYKGEYEIENDIYAYRGFDLDVKEIFPILSQVMLKNNSKYDRIILNGESQDRAISQFEIIGIRMETDEECEDRIKHEEKQRQKAIRAKENMKLQKEEKKKARELEQLEILKKKYSK